MRRRGTSGRLSRCLAVLGGTAVVLALVLLGGSVASATGLHGAVQPDQAVLQRATHLADRARLGLTPAPYELPWASRGLPSVGSPRVFALLISFSDYPSTATRTQVASRLFGDGIATDYPYDSLRNWHRRSSYGKLDIEGSVLGWYDVGQTRSSVTDIGDVVLRALQYFDPRGPSGGRLGEHVDRDSDVGVPGMLQNHLGVATFAVPPAAVAANARQTDAASLHGDRHHLLTLRP